LTERLTKWCWSARFAVVGFAIGACGLAAAQDVSYGIGSWPEKGHGNHRAVLRVGGKGDAVWAHIEWRRRDRDPEARDIRVFDATTGERVLNVARASVTREAGDLVFQPATAPGEYHVYYLPYNPGVANFDDPGTYFAPEDTADREWLARNGLTAEGLASGKWRALPRAELVEIQARSEFHRMDPMEILATEEETAGLLAAHPNRSYLLFPEDREHAIRMPDDLPLRWIRRGPADEFLGAANPGEYYVFQIGVYAARQAIPTLALESSDLKSTDGATIPASELTCFNLEGTDWLGRPIGKTIEVARGRVQALWIGLSIPTEAAGSYTGTVTVKPQGAEAQSVRVRIDVAGPVLEDGGAGDLRRLSRLKWLNSTLGLDDQVVPPFTPLEVRGDTVKGLLRQVRFGPLGLPASIISKGREVLAAPIAFTVETSGGPLAFVPQRTEVPKSAPGAVERLTTAHGDAGSLTVRCRMEADGCLTYGVTLKPARRLRTSDVRLEIPIRRDCAVYMMGMGKRGGLRPPEWHWKWDVSRANNMVWLGDVDAGLQVQLRGDRDVWQPVTLASTGIPPSWGNDGQGGCDITQTGDAVVLRAYTGARRLRPGEEVDWRFRLLITPFKPIDSNHWNWRYGDVRADGTVLHVHHGSPPNPYINYPFLTTGELTDLVRSVKAVKTRRTDLGSLEYPAEGNLDPRHGAVHIWTTVNFDPAAGAAGQAQFNQPLFYVTYPNQDSLGFYWNIDDRGMRGYVRRGAPELNQYPVLMSSHSPEWQRGERHLVTLSWGDQFAIFVDGKRKSAGAYQGTLTTPLKDATLGLQGSGFILDAVKITDAPYAEGAPTSPTVDEHTLLLDTFSDWDGGPTTRPERSAGGKGGALTGAYEVSPGEQGSQIKLWFREEPVPPRGVNIYYTLGQVSNHAVEIWPLCSLGDEIFPTRDTNPAKVGETTFGRAGGGYPWLREHLVSGYVPSWRQPLPWLEDTDAAIETQGLSRWHNYYVEGLNWLMVNTGLDGLYLDGIGYDREIMKRVAKVMYRNDPHSRINFHGGDCWSPPWDPDRRVSTANANLEHFPYISNLWFGELYDYNQPPDYWLVEISGIPFGLTSEMLNYQNGGNPYRGMVYGMSGRQHPSAPAMWRFWDAFGIQDAEMIGYWDPKCPVRTDSPEVLTTVYRKEDKALVALGHWTGQSGPLTATTRAMATPPTVDGRLSPGEWDGAARLTNFTVFEGEGPAEGQTEVLVTHDARRVYIGFRCERAGGALKAEATERDGPVWEDDAIEVFLQPDPEGARYVQLVGNSAGVFADNENQDMAWDGDWVYRASVGEGYWEGEAVASLESLGMKPPAEGQEIGVNFCRDQQTPRRELSCWSPASGTFHHVGSFGRLRFSSSEPVTRQERPGDAGEKALRVRLRVDWRALGLDPARTRVVAPAIDHFQPAAEFRPDAEIPIELGKGWLLVLEAAQAAG